MEIQEILSTLNAHNGSFPREAVEAAIERRDEIVPELIDFVKCTIDNADESIENDDWGFIYAVYLLAQFREKRAYPLVMELLSLPEKELDLLFGDYEGLDSVMASVSCGDSSLIKELVENREADEYIRSYALYALITVHVSGDMSREALLTYFKELFDGKLERETAPVWDGLVDCCLDLHADELFDDIIGAYDSELVWEVLISKKNVAQAFAVDKQTAIDKLHNNQRFRLIEDAVKEMERWACFDENAESHDENAESHDELADSLLDDASQFVSDEDMNRINQRLQHLHPNPPPREPIRTEAKIGRNQPCPCGSGKKYKKCCGKSGS